MAVAQPVLMKPTDTTANEAPPRCANCRHWTQDPACPEVGRCEGITVLDQWQLVHTEASFGCVKWEAHH